MTVEHVEAIPSLPHRRADGHKGLYGSVLALAGSRGMAGAAGLVGASALRSGAGLVTVASPAEVQPTVATFEPSYMTYPLPQDDEGTIDFTKAITVIEKLLARATVVAIGPGLGKSKGVRDLARWCIEKLELPTVMDADALNALSEEGVDWTKLTRPLAITPHPGEFSRLTGKPTAEIQCSVRSLRSSSPGSLPIWSSCSKGRGLS